MRTSLSTHTSTKKNLQKMVSFLKLGVTSPSTSPIIMLSSIPNKNSDNISSSLFSNSVALMTKNTVIASTKVTRAVKAMGGAPKFKGTQMREKRLTEMIEKKVVEAKEACQEDETSDKCKVAWDEVEEVSQAKAHLRKKLELEKQDPLQHFCQDNPETDECRVYED